MARIVTLSDFALGGVQATSGQRFRVRAGVFARAHGRPDGMPGRSSGARAKGLSGEGVLVGLDFMRDARMRPEEVSRNWLQRLSQSRRER